MKCFNRQTYRVNVIISSQVQLWGDSTYWGKIFIEKWHYSLTKPHLQHCHSFLYRRTKLHFEAWTNTSPTWLSIMLDAQMRTFMLLCWLKICWKTLKNKTTYQRIFPFPQKALKKYIGLIYSHVGPWCSPVYLYLSECVWLPIHKHIICSLLYSQKLRSRIGNHSNMTTCLL